jgi:hypothetical protein
VRFGKERLESQSDRAIKRVLVEIEATTIEHLGSGIIF